jgi:hypothetical protein
LSDITTEDSSAAYFFGASQVDLVYNSEARKYYKSSTPMLAVAKYLKRFNKDESF